MTEEEAIKRVRLLQQDECDCIEYRKDKEAYKVLLEALENQDNKIKELEKAVEEKDKIIEAMSDTIETSQYANIDNTDLSAICDYLKCKKECISVEKECIKEYFEKKEEKE